MKLRQARRVVAAVAALAVVGSGCSEQEPTAGGSTSPPAADDATGSVEATEGDGTTVLSRFPDATWFAGDVPAPRAADPDAAPLKVGFVNVDAGPIGAMPELHGAVDGAAAFINSELGGVDGRPIEVVPCLLSNPTSAEESQGCARQFVDAGVVAVIGGIGLAHGAGLKVLEDNGIPWVGGLPLNEDEMTSPISFQFSGGSPGAFAAFAQDAVEREGADRVAILYAEYPAIESAALDYGGAVAEALGAEVVEVPFPFASQDYQSPVQKAVEADADAILVGAADLACAPVMQALADLDTRATVYMVGACADRKQIDKVGVDSVVGTRFNIENRLDQTASDLADTEIYLAAMETYAPETSPRSAGTVAFRSLMNLWAVLAEIGPDATPAAVTAVLSEARDRPSFDGHPYTCDRRQIPALPAMCAPQQVIAELSGPDTFEEVSDGWVDVPAVLDRTGVGEAG